MRSIASLTSLTLLLFLPEVVSSEERDRLADALAVQEAFHQAIERAEPSIACVLVSRSDKYGLYMPVRPKKEGELGRFDPPRSFSRQDENNPEYQTIRRLDLSNL